MRPILFLVAITLCGSADAAPRRFRVCDPIRRECRIVTIQPGQPVPLGGVELFEAAPDPISDVVQVEAPRIGAIGSCGPDCKCVKGECGNPNCPTRKTLVAVPGQTQIQLCSYNQDCADGKCPLPEYGPPLSAHGQSVAADAGHDSHGIVRFGHGYGLANGDRMFYGPCSGVPFMRRGPVRRTVAVIATGQGPIARVWRSGRCSR